MAQEELVHESIDKLYQWVQEERYYGWDIYDALNSDLIRSLRNPYLKIIITQLNKYSFINFRHVLGINKGIDLKGIALFSQAYSKLYKLTRLEKYRDELIKCLSIIESGSLKHKYGYDCWSSHYFSYISADKSELTPDTPDIIGTSQAIVALVEGYKILKQSPPKEMAVNGVNFIINNLIEEENDDYFLNYTLTKNDNIVFNATAQGLEAISHVLQICDNQHFVQMGEKFVNFLIKSQLKNGSWAYSIYKNGHVRNQLDFHQGYIIDGLLSALPFYERNEKLKHSLAKGAKFYRESLFHNNGTSYYRYPLAYPVDIHNQAQGIITFSKISTIDLAYLDFSKRITAWTISNMQSEAGFYYYQKWPLFLNKIPYMRWGQAWMMLALSTLMEQSRDE